MDDETFDKHKTRLQAAFDQWLVPLGMNWWRVNFTYLRERAEDEPGTAMEVKVRWQYRHAGITAFLPAIADMEDDELEEAVVHELMHVLVNQMRDDQSDCTMNEERVCTDLSFAFVWLRNSLMTEKAEKPAEPVVSSNGHAPLVFAEVV